MSVCSPGEIAPERVRGLADCFLSSNNIVDKQNSSVFTANKSGCYNVQLEHC